MRVLTLALVLLEIHNIKDNIWLLTMLFVDVYVLKKKVQRLRGPIRVVKLLLESLVRAVWVSGVIFPKLVLERKCNL